LIGRRSPGAGGVAGIGIAGVGGGVTAGTEIGVCDGANGRAGDPCVASGDEGVVTDGHGVLGVGRGGGSVAPRGGVGGVCRTGAAGGGVAIGAVCVGGVGRCGGAGVAVPANAGAETARSGAMPTGITPPHAEHRARTPPGGTFAGSTR
jgi:hypothetical protein